jgi:coenzyme F420-0:L-glutamate ligase/coenzyme F420-1:gamma-L-glutamate ligase
VAEGTVLLLPVDPDASARALCAALRVATGLRLGVLITDTVGRPWRDGQTDIAIGAAGVAVLDDLRGTTDAHGRRLDVTVAAVADEIAGAADLIKGKTSGNPVAVLRGLSQLVGEIDAADRGARRLLRDSANDMFRVGSAEAYAEGYAAGLAAAAAAASASAATGVPTESGADAAPAHADEVGAARAAEDVSVSVDVPESAHPASPQGRGAAVAAQPGELPIEATVERANGTEVASRGVFDGELPVAAPVERANGTEVVFDGELPVAAPVERANGPEVASRGVFDGELPVAAPVERHNGPEVASRGVPGSELPVAAPSGLPAGHEVATHGTASA